MDRKWIRFFGVFLLCAVMLAGCAAEVDPEGTAVYDGRTVYMSEPEMDEYYTIWDMAEISFEEAVAQDTHIVDAEFLGFYPAEKEVQLLFQVKKVYKGTFREKNELIYVTKLRSDYRLEPGEVETYQVGREYMLFLAKTSSVYLDYDVYKPLGQIYMPETSPKWKETHSNVKKLLKESESEAAGEEILFTRSKAVGDAVAIAENIFIVRVEKLQSPSMGNLCKDYLCRVTQTVRNQPKQNEKTFITFFADSVEVGGEYLVMLSRPTGREDVSVYTLASPNSVFTLEAAEEIPELAALLAQATEYVPEME